jgi:hypothetical protein
MKKLFFLFVCVFFSVKGFATAQAPDYLIIDKDTLKIHSNPLEQYFIKNPLPQNLITTMSSGNWRGYIAYFKFVDNKLVVENIYKENYQRTEKGERDYSLISIYKAVFGEVQNFPCDFYTGLLICPYGEIVEYVHMGYSSQYENYKLFEIKSGLKSKSKDLTGEAFNQFKLDYYHYFKTTEAYKEKAIEFRKMMIEVDMDLTKPFMEMEEKNKKRAPKENKYLKQKEAEFRADKELDSFMFLFLDDYIKTIDIPNKQ